MADPRNLDEAKTVIARLEKENAQLNQSEADSITSIVKKAAEQLQHAVNELATVRVLTIIGDTPLRAELQRHKDAENPSAGAPPTFDVGDARGSITSINMATGDIQTFASADAVSGPLKALHDEAMLRGTAIMRENVKMLAEVIEKLWSRTQR
jgi:hypothetical protein